LRKPIVFMFSGQGSQYYHMGKELYEQNATFRQWMLQLDNIVDQQIGISIVDQIYNPEKSKATDFDCLLYTHPAIFMVEYSLARLLMESGLEPDYVLGASLGEFTCMALTGVLSLGETLQCLLQQAKLLERYCERGRMTAVVHNTELYEQLAMMSCSAELAGVNYSSHFIISGKYETIVAIEGQLKEKDILFQSLPVRYGFHSPCVDVIEEQYKSFLHELSFREAKIPIISCALNDCIKQVSPESIWDIIRKPINFQQTILKLEQEKQCSYIDVGPSGTLANFVKKNLSSCSLSQVYDILSPFGNDIRRVEKVKTSFSASR
jgi:bacillaene synthase trans-acting acyltransferase